MSSTPRAAATSTNTSGSPRSSPPTTAAATAVKKVEDEDFDEEKTPKAPASPPEAPIRPVITGTASDLLQDLQRGIGGALVGFDAVVRDLSVALISEGHVLLEGVPGLAKTYLVRTFARALDLGFRRIQFTPDMLPSDIMGAVVLDNSTQGFVFRPGPIFSNVILADEINRAPPKVQSALLEAMQERQITMEGRSYPLPRPFIVIATQNPVEQEGTYPLPEAELDRFLFRILLDYPQVDHEFELLRQRADQDVREPPVGLVRRDQIERLQADRSKVYVSREVIRYLMTLVRATRQDSRILSGASPRAGVQFLHATQALALFQGRRYVIPDDVRELALPLLNHRLVLSSEVLALQETEGGQDNARRIFSGVLGGMIDRIPPPR